MKKILTIIFSITLVCVLGACNINKKTATKEANIVSKQLSQLLKAQPVPMFDWSFERYLAIELYKLRNKKVATHAVWRSDYGIIEGDCPSLGFGIPYDVQLTNPLVATDEDLEGYDHTSLTTIEQPEPNGLYSSKNTSATWVLCVDENGMIEPIYIESHVTVYPYPVKVDYEKNRVYKAGKASVTIKAKSK